MMHRPYRAGYEDDLYTPYMKERAQEWDMKIHDPGITHVMRACVCSCHHWVLHCITLLPLLPLLIAVFIISQS